MTFGTAELGDLVELLRTAARVEIMPRFRKLGAGDVRQKSGPLDLVTEADEAAERLITDGLLRRFPGSLVIGEEAASADPSRLAALGDADLAFVVDPVDGTANFAAGLPLFGVMAAAIVRGEIVAAVIHDPVCDDTALAIRGEGAWSEAPDGRRTDLRVAAAGAGGTDDRQRVVALPSGAPARHRLRQPAAARRQLGLSLCRARVPHGLRRPLSSAVLQPADAMGPCAGLAAAPGGRWLFSPAGRQPATRRSAAMAA